MSQYAHILLPSPLVTWLLSLLLILYVVEVAIFEGLFSFLHCDEFLSCLLNILVTQVTLMEDVQGKLAEELVQKCPTGVFDIEDVGSGTVCFQNGI
jgi:hypothetical protein